MVDGGTTTTDCTPPASISISIYMNIIIIYNNIQYEDDTN